MLNTFKWYIYIHEYTLVYNVMLCVYSLCYMLKLQYKTTYWFCVTTPVYKLFNKYLIVIIRYQ